MQISKRTQKSIQADEPDVDIQGTMNTKKTFSWSPGGGKIFKLMNPQGVSIYEELLKLELEKEVSDIPIIPSETPWETIFTRPTHVLPPLTKLCSAFLASLLEKRLFAGCRCRHTRKNEHQENAPCGGGSIDRCSEVGLEL